MGHTTGQGSCVTGELSSQTSSNIVPTSKKWVIEASRWPTADVAVEDEEWDGCYDGGRIVFNQIQMIPKLPVSLEGIKEYHQLFDADRMIDRSEFLFGWYHLGVYSLQPSELVSLTLNLLCIRGSNVTLL